MRIPRDRAALDRGHAVVATVRGEHSLPAHDRLRIHRRDVRDRSAASAAVDVAVVEFGRLDVLVNNAGYGLIGATEEASEEDHDDGRLRLLAGDAARSQVHAALGKRRSDHALDSRWGSITRGEIVTRSTERSNS